MARLPGLNAQRIGQEQPLLSKPKRTEGRMKEFKKILATTLVWFALGALAIPLTGCASTERANSKSTEAATIDPSSGMPVWLKHFEQWNNEARTTASKTTIDKVQASEQRNADGSSSYNLNADGVATSPELRLTEKILDATLARAGFGPPQAQSPPSNQVTLSIDEYIRLSQLKNGEGITTSGSDPGSGPEQNQGQPLVALTADQFRQLQRFLGSDDPRGGSDAGPDGRGVPPAPQSSFTQDEYAQLRRFLEDQSLAEPPGTPEPDTPQVPAPPLNGN